MTLYETIVVVHPEKGPRIKEFIDRFKKVIEGQGGTVVQVDEWGLRELAYHIQKQGKGVYALLRYESTGRAVEELERNLKLTDGILRYLTVRSAPPAQPAHAATAAAQTEEASKPAQEVPVRSDAGAS